MNAKEFQDRYNEHFHDETQTVRANDIIVKIPDGPEFRVMITPNMTFLQAFEAQLDYMIENPDYRLTKATAIKSSNLDLNQLSVLNSKDMEYKNKIYTITEFSDGSIEVVNKSKGNVLSHKSPVTKGIIKFYQSNKSKS